MWFSLLMSCASNPSEFATRWPDTGFPDALQGSSSPSQGASSCEQQIERLVQPANNVDIVIAFNRGGSMSAAALDFADSSHLLFNELEAMGVDFRLSFAITDQGCGVGSVPFVSTTTPNRQDALVSLLDPTIVRTPIATNTERAFDLWEAFIEKTVDAIGEPINGCNEAAIRQQAKLLLVAVSDKADQSYNPAQQYLRQFEQLKTSENLLQISAIGPDGSTQCDSVDYTGIRQTVEQNGGFFIRSCQQQWSNLQPLFAQSAAPDSRQFFLALSPEPETLRVFVDNTETREFTAQHSMVIFNSAPTTDSVIEFRYEALGCE